jgi:hypothetical protein
MVFVGPGLLQREVPIKPRSGGQDSDVLEVMVGLTPLRRAGGLCPAGTITHRLRISTRALFRRLKLSAPYPRLFLPFTATWLNWPQPQETASKLVITVERDLMYGVDLKHSRQVGDPLCVRRARQLLSFTRGGGNFSEKPMWGRVLLRKCRTRPRKGRHTATLTLWHRAT